jgi:hypothetical protein
MVMQRRNQLDKSEKWAYCISFLDVLAAVPPFSSNTWEAKAAERRDRSQSSQHRRKAYTVAADNYGVIMI